MCSIALLAGMAAIAPVFAQTPDPATNAAAGGTSGAATGCIVTIPVGCAPRGSKSSRGGGVGATAGVASYRRTPRASKVLRVRPRPWLAGPPLKNPRRPPNLQRASSAAGQFCLTQAALGSRGGLFLGSVAGGRLEASTVTYFFHRLPSTIYLGSISPTANTPFSSLAIPRFLNASPAAG